MEIIAKAAYAVPNVMDKIHRGANGIEIQLLNPSEDNFFKDDWWNTDILQYVKAIHTPLQKEEYNGRIEDNNYNICETQGNEMLKIVCDRAEEVAKHYNRKITVIAHIDISRRQLIQLGLWKSTVEFIQRLADTHKNIVIAIENTVVIYKEPFTCVSLAKEVNRENVGNCLDTCHALIQVRQTMLLSEIGECSVEFPEFFKEMKDTLRWVHLSQSVDNGDGYGFRSGHGVPIQDNISNLGFLHRVLWYLKEYNSKCDYSICLEVAEKDYLNCTGFTNTHDSLIKALKQMKMSI